MGEADGLAWEAERGKMTKRLLILAAMAVSLYGKCAEQLVYAGPGFSGADRVGVAAFAQKIACIGEQPEDGTLERAVSGLGVYAVTGGIWSGGIKAPVFAVHQGAAIEVPGIPAELKRYINVLVGADLGVAQRLVADALPCLRGTSLSGQSITCASTAAELFIQGGGAVVLNILPARWNTAVVIAAKKFTNTPNPAITFGLLWGR